MTQAEKQAIIKEYATHEGDTGSSGCSSYYKNQRAYRAS